MNSLEMIDEYTYSPEIPKEREPEELNLQIDKRSNVPIFVQLENSIKYLVASGQLKSGERMPSVRKLAKALSINPNTVDKAYMNLENQGFIRIEKGRGTFVQNVSDNLPNDEKKRQLDKITEEYINAAFKLGYDSSEILNEIKERLPDKDE